MDHVLAVITVAALIGIAYPYAIYPALLLLLPGVRGRGGEGGELPSVSVLLSVYNEQDVIGEKIANFLALDYPDGLIDLWVVSDGSTDATQELVRRFENGRVRLITQSRAGKTTALNRAARQCAGEVLVFTDANAMFDPGAVKNLVAPFGDRSVGVVSGRLVPVGAANGEGFFYRLQRFLKSRESRLGAIAGADGAVYAIRSSLYRPLEPGTINDLFHPIDAAVGGYRSVLADGAVAYEKSDNEVFGEYSRQKRMVSQAAAIFARELPRLGSSGRYCLLWVLLSHKVARWMHLPALALFLTAASLYGLRFGGAAPFLPWGLYALFMLAGHAADRAGLRLFLADTLYKFEVVHIAYVHGILDMLRGRDYVVWNPRGGVAGK